MAETKKKSSGGFVVPLVAIVVLGLLVSNYVDGGLEDYAQRLSQDDLDPAAVGTLLGEAVTALRPWLVAALLAGVAVLAGRWYWRRRARRRREELELVGAALSRVMPGDWDAKTQLQARRWRGTSPKKLLVGLTASCADHDLQWRLEVRQALVTRLGALDLSWPQQKHRRRLLVTVTGSGPNAGADTEDGQDQDAAQRISHALGGLVPDPKVTCREDSISIAFGETTRDQSPQWRARVVEQVCSRTNSRYRATWDRQHRTVTLEPVPELPAVLKWDDAIATLPANLPATALPVGVDEEGHTVVWSMGDDAPHGLMVGETGSGKTESIKAIVKSALRAGFMVAIIDPKGRDFGEFLGKPGVLCVATSIEDRVGALTDLRDEMGRRRAAANIRKLLAEHPELADRVSLPEQAAIDMVPLLVVIDEMSLHTIELNKWWAALSKEERSEYGSEARQPPMATIPKEIVQLARAIKIHALIGLQRADGNNFGADSTEVRDNLGFVTSMGVLSPISSKMTWGDVHTGTTVEINARGEGLSNGFQVGQDGALLRGEPRRFKAYYTGTTPTSWWDEVAKVAPDTNLIQLPNLSRAALDPTAAVEALLGRAYGAFSGAQHGLAPVAGTLEDVSPGTTTGAGAPPLSDGPETDSDGRTWQQIPAAEIEAGDVVTFGDIDTSSVVEVEGWVEDEFTRDEVFRVVLQVDGEEQIVDLTGDESVWRSAAETPVDA